MQTFSLDICKRLAQTLGDKCPKTYFLWIFDPHDKTTEVWDLTMWSDYSSGRQQEVCSAFTIADLTGEVWQVIGEKLGWDASSPFARAWVDEPIAMYRAWLTGGYAEADKYLNSILPK